VTADGMITGGSAYSNMHRSTSAPRTSTRSRTTMQEILVNCGRSRFRGLDKSLSNYDWLGKEQVQRFGQNFL
jgi:hypothetical protein